MPIKAPNTVSGGIPRQSQYIRDSTITTAEVDLCGKKRGVKRKDGDKTVPCNVFASDRPKKTNTINIDNGKVAGEGQVAFFSFPLFVW